MMLFSSPQTPNLIIISVDCLRKDHLSAYGYSRQTSPNIDTFSQDATLFEDVISQSCWTIPSVASLFTLLYPSTHLTRGSVDGFWEENILNPKLVTLAELLKNEGYQTAAFIANHSLIKEYHFDQGFDLYDMIDDSSKPLAENVNKKVFSWLKTHYKKPFFMYLHYMDPHAEYGAPIPYRNFFISDTKRMLTLDEFTAIKHVLPNTNIWDLNTYIDMYDSEIRYVDHYIGELLELVRRNGLFDNTIVVITADHGEAFLEHGFCEHGNALYREEIDIPLIVRFPNTQPFPTKVTHRIEQIDVIQSILEHMGYGYPYPVHGSSITVYENDTACFSEEPSTHHKFLPTISMTENNFKAIYFTPKKTITDLYDLTSDPLERTNLVREKAALAEQFRTRIKAWATARSADARQLGIDKRPAKLHIDKNHINTLKALGYVR
ncbi:sulfatase [bacterium]|nr:sulfatase [bacterium]